MDVEKLINDIECGKYKGKSHLGNGYTDYNIVYGDEEKAVLRKIIYGWAAEQITDVDMKKRCAELEAKCYAYEKIIANSNFAPMLRSDATVFVPDPTMTPVPTEIIQESIEVDEIRKAVREKRENEHNADSN